MCWIFLCAQLASADTQFQWKPVEKGSAMTGVLASGRVVPQDGALNIQSARVQGRILSILKREGETVEEGTPLYLISSAECLSLAEEKRVANSKKILDLIDGVEKREKQLGLKLDGENCNSISTYSGVLTKRNIESGASFNLGDPLATILNTSKLTIELDIPERDQSKLKPGQKVTFQFASHPGKTYTSTIQNIVPTIDPSTRTARARLSPIALPSHVSLDELVFGSVTTGQEEATLKVPSSALVFYHSDQYVITGTTDKPEAVKIFVLNEKDQMSSIRPYEESKLKVGSQVVTSGAIFILKKLLSEAP